MMQVTQEKKITALKCLDYRRNVEMEPPSQGPTEEQVRFRGLFFKMHCLKHYLTKAKLYRKRMSKFTLLKIY